MQKRRLFFVILSLAAATLIWAAVAGAIEVTTRDLTPEELAKIEAGEVILESNTVKDAQGNSRGTGLAIGFINAPVDKVIDTILKYEDYPQFMPRTKKTVVTRDDADHINVEFTIDVFFIKIVYYMKHAVDRGAGVITFDLDKTKKNDIADTSGYWAFKPYKGGTIVYYSLLVDTGRAVPKKVEDYLTKRDLPNIVAAMKKRVETGK